MNVIQRFRRHAPIIAILWIAIFVGGYFWTSNSDALAFVDKAVRSSNAIQAKIGPVNEITLDPIGGYSEKSVNFDKMVRLAIQVKGTTKELKMYFVVTKIDDKWKIIETTVDGRPFTL